jgi:uncharacterized protein
MKKNKIMSDIFQIIRLGQNKGYFTEIVNTDVNIIDEDGQSLLHASIVSCNDEVSIDLLKRGISLNIQDLEGKTPLHYCALYYNIEVAKLILDLGGSLSIADHFGNTPLWTSVFNARGDYEVVKLYLLFGGDPNIKNYSNRSPLDFASQISDDELVNLLNKE